MDDKSVITGLDLQFARKRMTPRPPAKDVARAMGISASRVSRIENSPERVTTRMRERYLAALETCQTFRTQES